MEKKDEAIKTPKLKRSFSGLSLSSYSDSGSFYEAIEKPKKKPKLRRTSSASDISLLPSSDKESEEFSTNLFKVSRSDGQEMKPFNPKLLHSTPTQVQRASLIVDVSFYKKEESMWNDDDDSPVDEERLNECLERLAAEDLTKKEVEVEVDDRLRDVTTDTYHSLNDLERLNWITTQFIFQRYRTVAQGQWPRPPLPSKNSGKQRWIFGGNTDSEDSDKDEDSDEDEDPGNMMQH